MSIIVEQIVSITDSAVRAIVDHAGHKLDVDVAGPVSRVAEVVGQSLTVEIGYAAVVDCQILERESDSAHGLFQSDPSNRHICIVGRVHNVLALDDGSSLFDLYVQAGPEFLTFDSTAVSGRQLKVGDSVAITVRDLCFYPTWV
jgi:hypothetical protein